MQAVRDSDLSAIHGAALSVLMAKLPTAVMGFARSIASGSIARSVPGSSPLVAVIVPISSTYPAGLFHDTLESALLNSCNGRVLDIHSIHRELHMFEAASPQDL